MYWMNDHLMVEHEIEKVRRARQNRREKKPSPAECPPRKASGCARGRNPRR